MTGGGPPNNGILPITKTPSDQLGGDSPKTVTALPNMGSVPGLNPPQGDFVTHQPPGKSIPKTAGTVG